MKRIPNPEMDWIIIQHLSDKYNLTQKRDGIHLSTLVYCITKSFFDAKQGADPTTEEILLFSLGLGLQDVITPEDAETPQYFMEGITFSPDFVFKIDGADYCELKTTRMSSNKEELPETWIEYIMGGCHMRGVDKYNLIVLYMMGNYKPPFPQIHSEILMFDQEELELNWDRLMDRKIVYEDALASNIPPEPFKWCKEWECRSCRYHTQCDAVILIKKGDEDGKKEDR